MICMCVFLLHQESFNMILVNNPSFYDWGVTTSVQAYEQKVRPLELRSDMEFPKTVTRPEVCKWRSRSLATTSSILNIQYANVWTRGFVSMYVYLFDMVLV
jgi:hypothetical protein